MDIHNHLEVPLVLLTEVLLEAHVHTFPLRNKKRSFFYFLHKNIISCGYSSEAPCRGHLLGLLIRSALFRNFL